MAHLVAVFFEHHHVRREAQWFGLLARMAAPGIDKNVWLKQLDSIRQQPAHPYQREAKQLWKNTQ